MMTRMSYVKKKHKNWKMRENHCLFSLNNINFSLQYKHLPLYLKKTE